MLSLTSKIKNTKSSNFWECKKFPYLFKKGGRGGLAAWDPYTPMPYQLFPWKSAALSPIPAYQITKS